MSWSISWKGIGTDYDPSLTPAPQGRQVTDALLSAAQDALSGCSEEVTVACYGHNNYDGGGRLLPGSQATLQIHVLTPVAPSPAENAPPAPSASAPDAAPEAADVPSDAATEPEGGSEGVSSAPAPEPDQPDAPPAADAAQPDDQA